MNKSSSITAYSNKESHEQIRVIIALLAEFNNEVYLQVAPMEILEALKMKKANVSRAVNT